MKKKCVYCGCPVSCGGDRHAKGSCPPPHKKAQKQRKRAATSSLPMRGAPVAGVRKNREKHKGMGGGAG